MCLGIRYRVAGETVQVLFGPFSSKIPVLYRGGQVVLFEWGDDGRDVIKQPQLGPLKTWPQTCCVPLETVKRGEWDYLRPKPCKVMATAFALKDLQGITRWFDVPNGMCLQGLHASPWYEPKVYLVTVPANENQVHIAERWMRMVPQGHGASGEEVSR